MRNRIFGQITLERQAKYVDVLRLKEELMGEGQTGGQKMVENELVSNIHRFQIARTPFHEIVLLGIFGEP